MSKEIKKLPKEMQKAYEALQDRPDENTPEFILDFLTDDKTESINNYLNQFKVNEIVDFVDNKLLDLEFDDTEDDNMIYNDFAAKAVSKIMGMMDAEIQKSKPLKFYDDNKKIKRLKARDFSTIGDITNVLPLERASMFAKFYGVEDDIDYLELSSWEKRLFADKVASRQKIELGKN